MKSDTVSKTRPCIGAGVRNRTLVRPGDSLHRLTVLGRIAQSSEIADVVVFLASGKAGYMTANTVVIDGGIMQGSVGL
ncbi:MAG: SDR family oxidoreductase, partial [Actinomycetota bacterium]|nr:SDR family oxidoreductase [Actinomycetota bacterium]